MTTATPLRTLTREELLATADDFREWLEEKDPDKVVGRTAQPFGCPLACFLQEKLGEGAPGAHYHFRTGEQDKWHYNFATRVDWMYGKGANRDQPVSAQQAQEILDRVPSA